jgi:hypothetical protein
MNDKDDRKAELSTDESRYFFMFIVIMAGIPSLIIADEFGANLWVLCSAGTGSLAMLLVVRWVTLRSDPRHQNRPSDPP